MTEALITNLSKIRAERYERDLRDVLVLQSEVASTVAREIRIALTPEETKHLGSAHQVDPEAYEAYLKGRFHWYNLSREISAWQEIGTVCVPTRGFRTSCTAWDCLRKDLDFL
jgi:hypothetical protein